MRSIAALNVGKPITVIRLSSDGTAQVKTVSDRRAKLKGRRGSSDRYAYLPKEMLQSPAYKTLSHAGRSYLTALAAECNGHNNGRIKFTRDVAESYGLSSADTRTRCLQELECRGFIRFTAKVKGANPHRHCDLIRLTWHQMYEYADWNIPEMLPTNDWDKWH